MKETLEVFYPPGIGNLSVSPELVTASHKLLDFDRCPSEYLGILPQFPISFPTCIFFIIRFLVHLALGSTPLNCDTNLPCQ
jgi:hypothetical protein